MKKEQIQIDTEFIRLDSLLKLSGGAVTGGQAKVAIRGRPRFWSTGEVCTMRGKKMRPGDTAQIGELLIEVLA